MMRSLFSTSPEVKTRAFTLKGCAKMLFHVFCQYRHMETEKRFKLRIMLHDLLLEHRHHFYWEWKTNQPARSPRELQVSESELGVQVPAWSQKSHANGHRHWKERQKIWSLQSGGNHLLEHVSEEGRWPANKMGMIHFICHVSFLYLKLQSHPSAVHFKISSPSTPLLPGMDSNHPMKSNETHGDVLLIFPPNKNGSQNSTTATPIFGFQDLSPSSTFSMSKGSWQWNSFCSGAKSHHYMTFTWLTKSTHSCPNHLCDW